VILDLAEAFPFYYALTEKGFLILGAGGESNTPQRLSFTPGGGQAFAVREGLIAIAAREEGLRLLQVESSGNARLLATLALPGEALDVALDADGTRAYVAGGDGGVLAVDIADPAEPHLIGSLPEIATAETVAMAGSLLAVGSGGQVLLIDPSSAAGRVGLYAPLHRGRRLTIRDDYAYIADAAGGLKIIWLAAPDRPVQVYGEADRPAYDVQVEGDVAYVAEAGGLRILDVGNRYRPLEVSRLALPGQPQSVTLAPGRAFVALGEEGIAIVDTANLSEPRLIGRIRLAGTARATVFYGGYLYAAVDEAGLAVIEASRPGGETLLATLSLAGPALDVERRGRALYVAAGEAGLLAVDITRPERPALVGTLPPEPGHEMLSLSISGKRAYVADGEGFSVVDINQPARIGRLTYVRTPAIHMGLSGVYVYALSDDRITVYDARATAEPVYLRTYAALRRLSSIQVLDDRLFLTSMGEGPDVVALSIAAPDYPVELDNVGSTGHTYHARPAAGSLWLAAGYGGLRRYDLSEGGALIPRGGYGTPPDIARLALAGDRLLVGGRSGWALLGLAEGGSPRLIEQADRSVTVRGLALKDGAFAFSTDEPGIALYTPEDGGSPPSLLRRETSGPVVGLALDDEYLYAAGPEGLSIYERRYLQPVMYIRTPAPATGLALAGGLAYLSLADGNLAVVDVSSPGSGIALLDSLGTRRPTDLIPGPDGATIYGLADETISRLQVSSRDRFYVSRSGQLPAPAERGVFVGNLLGAFVPGGGTLSLYDLTFMDENVIPRGEIEMQGEALLVDGGLAFVAYGEEGLGVIDLTASGAGTIFHPEETHAVYRMGETLFALGSSLTAWDITRPAAPRLLATLPLLAPGTHIDPAPGGRLLLSLANGLSLIGWDGEEFTPIGHLTTVSAVDRAAQLGDRAYLALHSGGLLVADLSDPHNPEALFTYVSPSGQFVYDLLPLDESRLLVSWEGGVDLLEVETNTPDPDAAPRLLNVTPTGGGQALDIALSPDGALAALALGDDGAVLLSLADPRNPQVRGYASTPGDGLRAALDGETLYLADGVCGLRVFDLADPTAPQEVGYWS
ncbi:MAG TPA: hypothetical protein ENI95_10980, partial [Chloroflexi bacterium]|nr:hypothetical protein [Chloroflexota bacterium]